jgi:hypothetical protein
MRNENKMIQIIQKLMGKAKLLPNINHITPLSPHLTFPHIQLKVPETHIRITAVQFQLSHMKSY